MSLNKSADSKEFAVQSGAARFEPGNTTDNYSHVEPKYIGTVADQRDMYALGRIQQLRVGTPRFGKLAWCLYLTWPEEFSLHLSAWIRLHFDRHMAVHAGVRSSRLDYQPYCHYC